MFVPYTFGGSWLSYALIAPVGMSTLFLGSTPFTEQITGSKYSAYSAYQTRVDMFLPPLTFLRKYALTKLHGAQYVTDLDAQVWPRGTAAHDGQDQGATAHSTPGYGTIQ